MSRITYRGRDRWSHNGRQHGHGLPLEREVGALRFTTITAKWLAIGTLIYFGLQLLRPFIGESW